tara:strand:+ start:1627 stop:2667 length:1041 start_codon:yes stop_codon:yes gene_type:complete
MASSALYHRVLDNQGEAVKNLYRRRDRFYRRQSGKTVSLGLSQEEAIILNDRMSQGLTPMSPAFSQFWKKYIATIRGTKASRTVDSEEQHLQAWASYLRSKRLHEINNGDILAYRAKRLEEGWSARTANISMSCFNNLMAFAKDCGYISDPPRVKMIKTRSAKRRLYQQHDIDAVCNAALEVGKYGPLLVDFIRFLQYTGARMTESLRVRWEDVDWARRQVTIGFDGETKGREYKVVDFNRNLEAHLKAMLSRAGDSRYLFPTFRADADKPLTTLKSSLHTARAKSGLPGFNFHDCRHHFISYAVMAGVDYLTIAKWVGHKDGGILIGKVYGHLNNSHAKAMADKL